MFLQLHQRLEYINAPGIFSSNEVGDSGHRALGYVPLVVAAHYHFTFSIGPFNDGLLYFTVHAERPNEFKKMVVDFVLEDDVT